MKRRLFSTIAVLALLATSITGCGFVTVVPIGQEGNYTGKVVFDSAAEAQGDWGAVAAEITEKAEDLSTLLTSGDLDGAVAVKVSGKIVEYNTDTPKHYIVVEMDGYSGDEIRVQIDGPVSGTALRDAQSVKNFESFTNQTEWSQYGKDLNASSKEQVTEPLGIDESFAGKKVTVVGAATQSGGTILITAVSAEIE